MSHEIALLADALVKAQSEIKAAPKDRENPFFNSRYATLEAIVEACRGPLTGHGIAIVQGTHAEGETVTVTTMLLHASGQWIKTALALTPRDASPQSAGSAITYGRRYGLGTLVGVTAEEDDDGNAAQPKAGATTRKPADARRFAKAPTVTAAVEEIGKPDRPQTDPEDHTAESEDLLPQPSEDREFITKGINRKANEHQLTTAEGKALQTAYLKGLTLRLAAVADLNKLYMFLMDAEAVKQWREQAAK